MTAQIALPMIIEHLEKDLGITGDIYRSVSRSRCKDVWWYPVKVQLRVRGHGVPLSNGATLL